MGGDGQDVELVINDKTLLTRGQRKDKSEEQNHHSELLWGRWLMPIQQRCSFSSGKSFGPTSLRKPKPFGEQCEGIPSLLYKAAEHALGSKENQELSEETGYNHHCSLSHLALPTSS